MKVFQGVFGGNFQHAVGWQYSRDRAISASLITWQMVTGAPSRHKIGKKTAWTGKRAENAHWDRSSGRNIQTEWKLSIHKSYGLPFPIWVTLSQLPLLHWALVSSFSIKESNRRLWPCSDPLAIWEAPTPFSTSFTLPCGLIFFFHF